MGEIVKVKNASYARYEEVLLRRDNLRKEAEQYHLAFIREFGDLIERSFELKVECIKKKKEIGFCQKLANQGKTIRRSELLNYIESVMKEYYDELKSIIGDVELARSSSSISPVEVRKIKSLYYSLAKLIHPDMHPEFAGDEILEDYWQRICIAYQHNCLEDMTELDAMVRMYLQSNYDGRTSVEIENIDQKISMVEKEIEEIISTNPYLYRIMLGSEAAIRDKRREYEDEIEAYRKYSAQLDDVLETFDIEEMLS